MVLTKRCAPQHRRRVLQLCEILSYFTYFTKPLTPRLWALWPALHEMLTSWGLDYAECIVGPLENYISIGADVFASCEDPHYRNSLWAIVQHSLTADDQSDMDEHEVKYVAKLMDVALLNCKGRLNEWLWPYLGFCLERLTTTRNPGFETLLMNVLPSALLYDARLTLAALESNGKTHQVRTATQFRDANQCVCDCMLLEAWLGAPLPDV